MFAYCAALGLFLFLLTLLGSIVQVSAREVVFSVSTQTAVTSPGQRLPQLLVKGKGRGCSVGDLRTSPAFVLLPGSSHCPCHGTCTSWGVCHRGCSWPLERSHGLPVKSPCEVTTHTPSTLLHRYPAQLSLSSALLQEETTGSPTACTWGGGAPLLGAVPQGRGGR